MTAIARLDAEALMFLEGFQDSTDWFRAGWLPRYRETIETISQGLAAGRPEDLLYIVWKSPENSISRAGHGLLAHKIIDAMRDEFIQVTRDIYMDGSPANFELIVERFEGWSAAGQINFVPYLLIARAFAGIHPDRYHTTVDRGRQLRALEWFVEHTGFIMPPSFSWAVLAQALTQHLDSFEVFTGDALARNLFPWFVVHQVYAAKDFDNIKPGHSPRPATAYADLPAVRREIELRHNVLQTALYHRLVAEFGKKNVWTEYATGTGGSADAIARRSDGRCQLYEIKIAATAGSVVRQAMGQLLEYGFRTGGLEPVKLFAVGEPPLDEATRRFLVRLQADFGLDIDYLQVELPTT
jgi:hypothetical protein